MNDLYSHIERLGKEHGYKNMTVLCKAAGVPRSTMSELNNGRSFDLSKPNAQKFAMLLGVSLDDIYDIYGEQKEKAPIDVVDEDLRDYLDELRNRPEMRMLFSTTKTATKAQIEAIVKMVEEMQGNK